MNSVSRRAQRRHGAGGIILCWLRPAGPSQPVPDAELSIMYLVVPLFRTFELSYHASDGRSRGEMSVKEKPK
jgi:hypothetical protein